MINGPVGPVVVAAFLFLIIIQNRGCFMNQPVVQVIIPVYNAQKYLRECFDSLISQTYTNWEAIVIDDASADSSAEIIKEYAAADSRFTYILQEKNKGVSNTRNLALSMLTGEYTAFLDSDDYWDKDMLMTLVKKAEESQSDVVQCRFIYDFSGGRTYLPTGAFNKDVELSGSGMKKVIFRMLTGINMNHVCMKLIKTELLKGLSFNTELRTAEDLQFCVHLFEKVEKYSFINKAMYHYRRVETSLTGSGLSGKEKIKANAVVSKDIKNALPSWNIDTPLWRFMCDIRPIVITVSKIFRIFREKIYSVK